ncbi:hypothetical protein B0T11DRAFT_128477 [Plectosphaerella cucumerina]|uniref:Nephrocystin 3-like N-terminal domain-containing protein n=1 Tax=Plectosphaerella cucumerina TaxID=40658 RepID=A0A8K0X2B6_9PEZI|nr:hypothetical protein B0T11DRAFT_128477 [Plectosphaerella cucumerina]
MDPVSIVGVAAAAIQFCTFTTSIATATWRATSSSKSLTADANDLEAVSARLKEMVEHLGKQLHPLNTRAKDTHLDEMEGLLQKICADCLSKAERLHAASLKIATQMNQKGRMQALWEAFKTEFNRGDIQSLTNALAKLQNDISSIFIVCDWGSRKDTREAIASLSKQMTALYNMVLASRPGSVSETDPSPFVQNIARSAALRSQSILENIDWSGDLLEPVWHDLMQELASGSWPREPMDKSESTSQKHMRLAKNIISKLRFDQMQTRYDSIAAPHTSTFEWIWHIEPTISEAHGGPKWSSFPVWLEGPSTTPYWVTGRPGSGKSTLMRFIEGHRNLQHHLSQWRPELRLQVLSYYAWNPGSGLQKSIEGLIRTILFRLLENEPHLLPVVLPRRWAFSTATWSTPYPPEFEAQDMQQLVEGLMCLLSTIEPSQKLMILVDGLDEFQVAPKELIRTMESISKHDNVRLCVASRPWNDFEDSFESWAQLKIHELTTDDINQLTHDKFQNSKAARKRPLEAEHLRTEIQKHAGGVFQWVGGGSSQLHPR